MKTLTVFLMMLPVLLQAQMNDSIKLRELSIIHEKELYFKGVNDALNNYKGSYGAAIGTGVASFIGSPVIGLIPAITCSSSPQKKINLDLPINEYSHEQSYIDGYSREAFQRKKARVWTAYGIGVGLNIIALIIIVK